MIKPAFLPLDGSAIDLAVHPQRDAALDEIHARPFHRMESPRRVLHFSFQVNHEQAMRDREAMSALCARHLFTQPADGSAYHRLLRPDYNLRWEQHTEFTSQTWDFPLPPDATALRLTGDTPLPLADFWQPGPMLVALDLLIVPAPRPKASRRRSTKPASPARAPMTEARRR